jgi:hypothetical protein
MYHSTPRSVRLTPVEKWPPAMGICMALTGPSCLIRKKVRFREYIDCDIKTTVNDQLTIGFRPVMTEICSVEDCHSAPPPVTDFPIVKAERYIPHWLTLDYDGEDWVGEFGYS